MARQPPQPRADRLLRLLRHLELHGGQRARVGERAGSRGGLSFGVGADLGHAARGCRVPDGLLRPLRAVPRGRQMVHRLQGPGGDRDRDAHHRPVRRRLVDRRRQVRLVRRLRAVAHRRHRRHRDAALVRLLDAGRRLVGSGPHQDRPDRSAVLVRTGVGVRAGDDVPLDADHLGRGDPRRRTAAVPAARRSHRRGDRSHRADDLPDRLLGRRVLGRARRVARRTVSVRRLRPPVAAACGRRPAGSGVPRLGRLPDARIDFRARVRTPRPPRLRLHDRRIAVLPVRHHARCSG